MQVSRLSELSADHLWKVVTDQGRFDQFMPYVRKTTVQKQADGTFLEQQILDLPHKTFELELRITLSQNGNTRTAGWRQTKGSLDVNEGAWVVESAAGKSILRYQVSASISWLPHWAVNQSMRPRLAKLLESVETRVRDLEQKEPGYFAKPTAQ